MNVPKYFAAKRTIHEKFHRAEHKGHHVMWSSLLLHDLHQIERKQKVVLQKGLNTAYSLYLDELIVMNDENKLFVHNYFNTLRTISGADTVFSAAMRDYFDVDSQFGRASNDFVFAQQVHESLKADFVARAQSWSAKERLSCIEEIELAKSMIMDVITTYDVV